MVAYWETVVALFIGFLVFGETMTVLAMIGGAMIVLGGIGPIVFMIKARKGGSGGDEDVAAEPTREVALERS